MAVIRDLHRDLDRAGYYPQLVADVLSRDERDAFEAARDLLLRQGIPVIEAGPTDHPALLLRKIGRGRPSRQVA